MPRKPRRCPGGLADHACNRATARQRIFDDADDYLAFERVLAAARKRDSVKGSETDLISRESAAATL